MRIKAPLEGPKKVLTPIYNSNVAKVYIIKWSQNLIWAYRSGVLGIPKYACKAGYFTILDHIA